MSTKIKITCKDETSPIDAKIAVCAKYPPYKSNIIIFHIIRDEQACDWYPKVEGDHVDVTPDNTQDIFTKFSVRESWTCKMVWDSGELTNPVDDVIRYDIRHQYSVQYTGNLDEYEWDKIEIGRFGTFTKDQFRDTQGQTIDYQDQTSGDNIGYNGPSDGTDEIVYIDAKIDDTLTGTVQCYVTATVKIEYH